MKNVAALPGESPPISQQVATLAGPGMGGTAGFQVTPAALRPESSA